MSAVAPQGLPPAITIGGSAAGPGAGAGPSPDAGPSDGDWEQDLQAALAALRELAADAQDHVETNVVDTCIKALSGLLAGRQKGAESAYGVTPAHKAMSRAY